MNDSTQNIDDAVAQIYLHRCTCGGTLALDTTAEKPIIIDGEPRTVVVSVLACNQCERVFEVLR